MTQQSKKTIKYIYAEYLLYTRITALTLSTRPNGAKTNKNGFPVVGLRNATTKPSGRSKIRPIISLLTDASATTAGVGPKSGIALLKSYGRSTSRKWRDNDGETERL
jgi:hypothetical protein